MAAGSNWAKWSPPLLARGDRERADHRDRPGPAPGHLESVGRMMAASHRSLRDYYEVSCPELEAMWQATQAVGSTARGWWARALAARCWPWSPTADAAVRAPRGRGLPADTGRKPNVFAVQIAEAPRCSAAPPPTWASRELRDAPVRPRASAFPSDDCRILSRILRVLLGGKA